jgi:hypothetical protein
MKRQIEDAAIAIIIVLALCGFDFYFFHEKIIIMEMFILYWVVLTYLRLWR